MKFGLEALRQICGQPTRPLADCPTCRAIPDKSRWFEEGDEVREDTIPPEAGKLVRFIEFDGNAVEWVSRCAGCGRIYWMMDEYDYSANSPSTTDRRVTRLAGAEDLYSWMEELIRPSQYVDIVRDGDGWHLRRPPEA